MNEGMSFELILSIWFVMINSHVFHLCLLVLVARDYRGLLLDLVDPLAQVVQESPRRPYSHEDQVHPAHQQDPQGLFIN